VTGSDIRVVIADDHPVVRDGLSALLASVPSVTVAGVAANGREAVHAAVTLRPDVLVMDVQMPGLTGVEAAREIGRVAPQVAVLMLTMFDDDYSVLAAMRAGARGYVLKGAQQDEIVRAIQAVAAGEAIFGPGIARLVLGLVSAPPTAEIPFQNLTSREREVLDLSRRRAQRRDSPAHVDRPQDRRQPRLRDLRQAPSSRPGRGHHPRQGRRPRPQLRERYRRVRPSARARRRDGQADQARRFGDLA
jgi:DNA-binding NarL/FixJ family response regulator